MKKDKKKTSVGDYGILRVKDLKKFLKGLPDKAMIYTRGKDEPDSWYGWTQRMLYEHPKEKGDYGNLIFCASKFPVAEPHGRAFTTTNKEGK